MLFNKLEIPQLSISLLQRPLHDVDRGRRRTRSEEQRLLAVVMALCGRQAELVHHKDTAWASITFSGKRHEICLRFNGSRAVAAGEELITTLPDHEFSIPGKLVADANITKTDHRLIPDECLDITLEILLLDDA